MNPTMTIARKEVKNFFQGFKGIMILFLFLSFIGWFFNSFISNYHFLKQQTDIKVGNLPSLDDIITSIFHNLHFILIMIIPAVTMTTFSGVEHNKTNKLLFSSPLSPASIVLGKFGGIVSIVMVMMLLASVQQLFLAVFGDVDTGAFLSAYLGFALLCFSHISFGMWVSSMCSSQILSFIFTLFGFILMLVMGWLAPTMTSNGFVESFLVYLAALPHLEPFLQGTVALSHTAYFLIVTGFFLFLTHMSVDSKKWR
jgi:ABC-2 type transport system permease protein